MSAQIIPFRFEDSHEVRAITIDGEPWFVASDVTPILGYAHGPSAIRRLDSDEYRQIAFALVNPTVRPSSTLPPRQPVTVVNEAGLYSLILWSQKEEAKPFRRWITHTVIPQIRKTGSYGAAKALPQSYAEALRALADEAEAHELARVRIRELEPAASAWHAIADAAGDFSVGDAAKMLSRDPAISTGERRLFEWMQAHGWIFRRPDGRPCAYQSKVDAGLLVEKIGSPYLNHRLGEYVAPAPTIRVTPKGMDRLYRDLGGMEPLLEVAS